MDDADSLTPAEVAFHESRGASGMPEEAEAPKVEAEKPADKPVEAKTEEKPGEKEPEVQKLVPHGAFEEERQRRKAAEQERQRLEKELARFQGREEALKDQKPADQQKPAVDLNRKWTEAEIELDPIGHMKWQNAVRAASDKAKEESERQFAEQGRISEMGKRHAEEFAKTQPNFKDSTGPDGKPVQGAYNFLRAKAFESLRARFPGESEEKIYEALNMAELNHIKDCAAVGANAASKLWEIALEQGYKAPEPPKPEQKGPTEAERIKALEEAQKASASLSSAAGGGGDGEPSLKNIADMSDEEFANIPKGKLKKMMGG